MLRRLKWWMDRRVARRRKHAIRAAAGRGGTTREPAALDMLVNILIKWEGFRSRAYQCSGGVWTYGYGSTYRPDGGRVEPNDTITKPQARALLTETAVSCLKAARELTDGHSPSQGCLAAIASLIYNVGASAVSRSRFLAAWKRGDIDAAKAEYIDFNKSGGKVVQGLINRREAEWAVLTGRETS